MQALRLLGTPLLLGAVVWWVGPQALWATLRGADGRWLLAGLLCFTAANALAALRWGEMARWLGHRVSARWALAVYFRGSALNAVLPGAVVGGDVFRAWQLHRHGCGRGAAGLSVALDRLSGLWILFALSGLAVGVGIGSPELTRLRQLLHVPEAWPTLMIVAVGVAAVLALPLGVLWAAAAFGGTGAQPGSRRAAAVLLLRQPEALRQYAWQAAASLVVQCFNVGALYCSALAFGVTLPGWLIAFTTAPIVLLASMPVSFGGWGTREMATVVGWSAFGTAPAVAVGAAAAYGVYPLLLAVLAWLPRPQSGDEARPDASARS